MAQEKSPYPFFGYAPGNYMNKCAVCEKNIYNVDKLCFICLECAINASQESTPTTTVGGSVAEKAKKWADDNFDVYIKLGSHAAVQMAFLAGSREHSEQSPSLTAYQTPSNTEGQEERKHELENWEEAWDKASEHIDDDLSSLEMVAGRSVIKHHEFLKLSEQYTLIKK